MGWAILLGTITGAVLYFSSSALFDLLNLNKQEDKDSVIGTPPPGGHTAASYRAARQQKKMQDQARQVAQSRWLAARPILGLGMGEGSMPEYSPRALKKASARARADLLSTTILEEESSTSI